MHFKADLASIDTGKAGSGHEKAPCSIAWRYLDQSRLLTGEHEDSARFILNRIDRMMLRGERRRLLLPNAAIDAYRLRPVLVPLDA